MNFASNCIFIGIMCGNRSQPNSPAPAPAQSPEPRAQSAPPQPQPQPSLSPAQPAPVRPDSSPSPPGSKFEVKQNPVKTFGQNPGPKPYTISINPKPYTISINPKPYTISINPKPYKPKTRNPARSGSGVHPAGPSGFCHGEGRVSSALVWSLGFRV